ncbi:MAG TPA: hypothetical protein VMU43_09070 [Candidatus Acidoferrum sp.]|nr:hypothetical protein [Candidatus Acidoferrum sp.]
MNTPEKRDSQERPTLGARLDAMVNALAEAQQVTESSNLDARVQIEFRHALDHTRHTASAVQQWFDADRKSGSAYAVLPALATQRVHRTTELAKDLSVDLENMDVTIETEGLQDLYQAVGQLHRQLEVLCKREK